MSDRIVELQAELARLKRPERFWTAVVVTLSVAFVGEVGLVMERAARPATMRTRIIRVVQTVPVEIPPAAPAPAVAAPSPRPSPAHRPVRFAAPPPPRQKLSVDPPKNCGDNDPLCGLVR